MAEMDMKEKLVELLSGDMCKDCYCEDCEHENNEKACIEHIKSRMADHLIANGVTVQEEAKLYWKTVKPGEWNLTCSACDSHLGCREDANFCPECGARFVYPKAVAPQPPKEESQQDCTYNRNGHCTAQKMMPECDPQSCDRWTT